MDTETQVAEAMANGREGRRRDQGGTNTVLIGPRDSLVGKLTVEGEIRVRGNVEGELHASGDVYVDGHAKASIEGRNVTIRGEVDGDVTAAERLLLAGSGSLNGNAKISRLLIEDGATLNGNVSMTPSGGGKRGEHQAQAAEGQPG